MSTSALGPWTTASSVPQVIYTIPPSSPVYNVTYVTQVTTSSGDIQSSYTAGYLGAFVMGAAVGAIVTSGTGYYYPPYVGYPACGYPVYLPYATPYGVYGAYGSTAYYHTGTEAYGVSQTAYGPYGSATRTASYNPYTEHRREPLRHRPPMANRVWARRTIRTPDRMAPLIKDRAPRRNGDNRTSRRETSPPLHNTIQRRMGR